MLMENWIITDDIYKDSLSLTEDSYHISEELSEEARALDKDVLNVEIYKSYKFSGRFWIWRIGAYTYKKFWENMVENGEMWIEASGFKYLMSYSTPMELNIEYERLHPDKKGITSTPPAYYAFANDLMNGDVVMVCYRNEIVGWGMVESPYMYRPTRTFGCHYRKVLWHDIKMPFMFSVKRPAIYQVPRAETHLLKDTLVSNVINDSRYMPLPFQCGSNCKMCDVDSDKVENTFSHAFVNPEKIKAKQTFKSMDTVSAVKETSPNEAIGRIIASLLLNATCLFRSIEILKRSSV